jgi:hypothetical protein
MKKTNTSISRTTLKHITEGAAFLKSDASDKQIKKKAINHYHEQVCRLSTELNLKVPYFISLSSQREERKVKIKSTLIKNRREIMN